MDKFRYDNTEGYTHADLEHLNAALAILMVDYDDDDIEQMSKHYGGLLHDSWFETGDNSVAALVSRVCEI